MNLRQLFENIPHTGELPELEITDLVYDSRKTVPGCLFICLTGKTLDGHRYADSAVQNGAAAILAEHPIDVNAPVIVVENTRRALALLSAAFFGHPAKSLQVIGITGTKGKTTTSYMIRSILEAAGKKTGVIGTNGVVIGEQTFPTQNTTPESYEVQKSFRAMLDAGCRYCVIEASSIGLRDCRVDGFTFEVGVFTNFSEDHIGENEHKNMQEYLQCKAMLFSRCKQGVLNRDDPAFDGVLQGHTCSVHTYAMAQKADFTAEAAQLLHVPGMLGVTFTLCSGRESVPVTVPIPGDFSVYNALAAAACCRVLGIDWQSIQNGLASVRVKGRVEPVPVPGKYTLLIDYAHNAVSMESILTTLRQYHPKRLVCLFGAGGNRPKMRRYEMGQISGRLADLSVITEDNSRMEDPMDIIADILTGMKKTDGAYVVVPKRQQAIRYCLENAREGDVIVLAGKGNEDYLDFGGVKHHFDEREVVAQILAEHAENGCGTREDC